MLRLNTRMRQTMIPRDRVLGWRRARNTETANPEGLMLKTKPRSREPKKNALPRDIFFLMASSIRKKTAPNRAMAETDGRKSMWTLSENPRSL